MARLAFGRSYNTGMPLRFTAVIFDWDDTLLDSSAARDHALGRAFASAGIDAPLPRKFMRAMQGSQLLEDLARLKRELDVDHDLIGVYRRSYWVLEGMIELYTGVRRMIETLHAEGVKLGIVTQKTRALDLDGLPIGVTREMAEVDVDAFFSAAVGSEDAAHYKPHLEGVHRALEVLGVMPGETLFVGDSAADMLAAQAAGCLSCHATWGLADDARALDGVTSDVVTTQPVEVLDLVFR